MASFLVSTEQDKSLFERMQAFSVGERDKEVAMKKITLLILLLLTVVSGCSSAISNSESYYRDIPRAPINWREYMTD